MATVQSNHPLPAAPGQGSAAGQAQRYQYQQQQQQPQRPGQPPQVRPRSKSSFSFRSDRSHKSSGSAPKLDLTESHSEKQSRRLTSKADPTLAMNEAEPSVVASEVATSLAPLRAIQHMDGSGNPIAEPDRSNPTRSRWERPLDTIRSFEAAIDGNYSRKTMVRAESSPSVSGYNTRRSSAFYGGSNVGSNVGGPRNPPENHYGARPAAQRPDSYYDGGADAQRNAGPSNGYAPGRQRYPRTASEQTANNAPGVYPQNGNQQSYETVTTASGSNGSYNEPAGYATDPSSENSSVDRIHASYPDAYGYNGAEGGQQPQMRQHASYGYGGPGADMQMINENKAAEYRPRAPIKLGPGGAGAGANASPGVYEPPKKEKRKSWLGRRFSKN